MISDKILNVAVYCSAAGDLPESWVDAARELGRWIGRRGATLVYGGVDAGLMTVVARGVRDGGGGRVTGVIPDLRRDMASPLNDTEIAVAGLAERKAVMCRMAATTLCSLSSTHLSLPDLSGKDRLNASVSLPL